MRLYLLVLLLAGVCLALGQELNVIPSSPVAFTFPCANDPKLLIQTYRVRGSNNNWEGIFFMDQFRDIVSVRLQVVLDNPAVVTLKNTHGNVISNDNRTFQLSTFKIPPDVRRIEFNVNGLEDFPHLRSLAFNNKPLCDNSERDLSAPFLKKSKTCGKVLTGKTQGLIANTYEASPGAWPWHVAIFHLQGTSGTTPDYKCGGTLISSNVVLTG